MSYRHNTEISADENSRDKIAVLMVGRSVAEFGLPEEAEANEFGLCVSTEGPEFEGLESRIQSKCPDVLLINTAEEKDRGKILGLLRALHRNRPGLKCILVISNHEMDFLVAAVQHGARGLVSGDQLSKAHIGECIRRVHDGQIWISNDVLVEVLNAFSKATPLVVTSRQDATLTPRELEVMTLVTQGLSNREIANVLRVTESTVKKFVYEVFNKTGASSRVELVLRALRSAPAA
jgi:two-component system nitrate/nitrite response regulator NarL